MAQKPKLVLGDTNSLMYHSLHATFNLNKSLDFRKNSQYDKL